MLEFKAPKKPQKRGSRHSAGLHGNMIAMKAWGYGWLPPGLLASEVLPLLTSHHSPAFCTATLNVPPPSVSKPTTH